MEAGPVHTAATVEDAQAIVELLKTNQTLLEAEIAEIADELTAQRKERTRLAHAAERVLTVLKEGRDISPRVDQVSGEIDRVAASIDQVARAANDIAEIPARILAGVRIGPDGQLSNDALIQAVDSICTAITDRLNREFPPPSL